jgi:hypothetical protein
MTDKKLNEFNMLGVGLDCGTMNLVSARRTAQGIQTKRMRDVFIDLPATAKKMLKLSSTSFVDHGDEVLILGDAALETANVFGKEPRRPLSGGIISPSEMDSLEVLGLMIKSILGDPRTPGEACYFSVPADPIDRPEKDIIYHRGVFERIVTECGYKAYPGNEAMGIIYSETAAEGFSGVALSWGAGMVNCALSIGTIEGLSFSVAKSGDWIDAGAAGAVGQTKARICALKERGFDLMNPVGREQEALAFYYKSAINYALDKIEERFKEIQNKFSLAKEIPLIISGGTSMAGGFMEFFNKLFEERRKKFPVRISEIRQAKEPLNAVAYGLLIQAIQEHEN